MASYIPPREQRELRDLMRYRTKIIRNITSEKNWIIQVLKDCNVKLSSVLNSTQGVISTKHIEKLCEKKPLRYQTLTMFTTGRWKRVRKIFMKPAWGYLAER